MGPIYEVIISPRAMFEMEEIFDYIALDSPQNAQSMIDRLSASILSLEQMPRRHPIERAEAEPGYEVHAMPVWPYLIFYKVNDQKHEVYILSIWHGARIRPESFE